MGQGFIFPTVLSALYITFIFHIFEKRTQNLLLPIFVLFLSFIDNGLFISQEKSFEKSNVNLFCSYSIISSLFEQFDLSIEHNKLKVFHFSRSTMNFNPSLFDLGLLDEFLLYSKDKWRYLGFIFDRKLTFCQHVHFYSNKALSTVKSMKMLGNLLRDLLSLQKQLLYQTCIMPIVLYRFQLWYFKEASIFYPFKKLRKI